MGRSKLHEVANYFGLAHHSAGTAKTKTRRTVMYPKTLYIEKQEREKTRLEKERAQLYEKFSTIESFVGIPPEKPLTFREQVMKEIWDTKFSKDKDKPRETTFVTTNMLNLGDEIGKEPDAEKIKKLIAEKKKDLKNQQEQMEKRQVRAKEQMDILDSHMKDERNIESQKDDGKPKPKSKKAAKKEEKKKDDQMEESDEDVNEYLKRDKEEVDIDAMDEETREAYMKQQLKILQVREADAQKVREFEERVQTETLKSFKDCPDEVK